jgi:DNA-binding MarR family transcriptional regulator
MCGSKIDYRKGLSPSRRTKECWNVIRNTLKQGKKTFADLVRETGLSRSTLAFHLKEKTRHGFLWKETDQDDCRIKYYSLTPKGIRDLRRQEDINYVASAASLLFPLENSERLAAALIEFFGPSVRKYLLDLGEKDFGLLREGITYSIYSDSPMKKEVEDYARKLAERAFASIMSEFAIPLRRDVTKKLPKISIVFRFNWAKIDEYLQKFEDENNKETLPKLPDIKDYLEKQ